MGIFPAPVPLPPHPPTHTHTLCSVSFSFLLSPPLESFVAAAVVPAYFGLCVCKCPLLTLNLSPSLLFGVARGFSERQRDNWEEEEAVLKAAAPPLPNSGSRQRAVPASESTVRGDSCHSGILPS